MKKIFNLIIFIFIISYFIPSVVFAEDGKRTLEEAETVFENFGISVDESNNRLDLNMIDFDTLINNSCTVDSSIDTLCKSNLVDVLLYDYFVSLNDEVKPYVDYTITYDVVNNIGELKVFYFDENDSRKQLGRKFSGLFEDADDKNVKNAYKVLDNVKNTYMLAGYNTINSYYHYGNIMVNDMYNPNVLPYRFQEVKDLLIDNDQFDYVFSTPVGGTTGPTGANLIGGLIVKKDGVITGFKKITFALDYVFYVDKDDNRDVYVKAQERLNNFFRGKVAVTVDAENGEYDQDFDGYFTEITIKGEKYSIFIKEVSKEQLDEYEVNAKHKYSGIFMETDSFDVPSDAILDVKNKKDDKDVIKAFNAKKFKLVDAYNIDIVKNTNGSLVKEVEGGVVVYIPINGKKLGDKIRVFHVTDENIVGDEFEGEVVELEGNKYVKFETTHFSTYAIVEALDTVTNPNTSDNILFALISLVVGSVLLGGCFLLKPRKN